MQKNRMNICFQSKNHLLIPLFPNTRIFFKINKKFASKQFIINIFRKQIDRNIIILLIYKTKLYFTNKYILYDKFSNVIIRAISRNNNEHGQ